MKHIQKTYKDYLVSGESFSLIEVPNSHGLLQTSPTPKVEKLSYYYESEDYISHSDSAKSLMDYVYLLVKKFNLKTKTKIISQFGNELKILDYGCGTGELVHYLNQNNFNAFGYEPNPKANEIASNKSPNKIYSESEFLEKEKFDVITLWHVLEHIPDLKEKIQQLKNSLNPNGRLVIAVPNYQSYDAKYYQEYWAAYDVPRHLWHFSPTSMEFLMNQFGIIIEKRLPMFFDSYYVSMLSEKYKRSSLGIFKAMGIGTISNLKGLKNGQFSSIIYVCKVQN